MNRSLVTLRTGPPRAILPLFVGIAGSLISAYQLDATGSTWPWLVVLLLSLPCVGLGAAAALACNLGATPRTQPLRWLSLRMIEDDETGDVITYSDGCD